ncbi:transglutaminase-like cysteine peptidase [uncultured Arcobacter sp.]|uniref:transglutaminase-like cysteine peptidase n=1 Tax=uncultured Arcobacter sp. TaxID=165434 RepID=UPI002621CA7B|nr:transglutaminase-like cysteine peptidase [uncultured Arcobacter sp.]
MNWFKSIWEKILALDNKEFEDKILELESAILDYQFVISQKDITIEENLKIINQFKQELEDAEKEIDELFDMFDEVDELETYWNNKRPSINYKYPARPGFSKSQRIPVDPRIFWVNDSSIPRILTGNDDTKAMNALKRTIKDIQYISDTKQFKENEVWLFPFETQHFGMGDCEDGAIYLANIMLKSGIPYWRIRLNAGNVKGGGHCWVTYLRESDNKWYILDWCYWADESLKWKLWDDAEKYYDIWFSWNKDLIFKDDELDR